MAVIERLRDAVRRDGRTLKAIAAEAGVDHSCLSRFMRGQRKVGSETVERLAAALGLELRPVARKKGVRHG